MRIASLLDLAGMKAAVVQKRAEAKDYIDLDAIIQNDGDRFADGTCRRAMAMYGHAFNPELTLQVAELFWRRIVADSVGDDSRSTSEGRGQRVDLSTFAADRSNVDHEFAASHAGRLKPLPGESFGSKRPRRRLSDPVRFLAYAMTYGDDADMRAIRAVLVGRRLARGTRTVHRRDLRSAFVGVLESQARALSDAADAGAADRR